MSARRTAGTTANGGTWPLGFVFGEAVLLDARVELRPRQAEQPGGARLVVASLGQRLDDERALERIEVDAAGGKGRVVRLGRGWRLARGVYRQMLAANEAAVRENDGAVNGVAQLAHGAGPRR